ncbi:hypothetical protein HT136_20955 [Novosphingobium profundi]|uniref:hypothetical protein n=1 Tax=Novosphingobium profundi TaxID=1774954 RepID=UPI001BDAA786|nr:hypothetical protein [Novosphingobium profundi]MBT0670841.1 hypothetical protein [Novosphingobium profundi]
MLTSSGGIRDLNAKLNSNRSATSFHYSGRALDLFVWSGMQKPEVDPYVVQRLGDRRYNVYARCSPDRAEAGSLPPISTVDDAVTYANRVKGVSITGHFLDLTKLFGENGFRSIRARKGFETGEANALGAEWWHFQWEDGLNAGVSTFGDELKRIYPMAILQTSAPWAFKDYVWQVDWF